MCDKWKVFVNETFHLSLFVKKVTIRGRATCSLFSIMEFDTFVTINSEVKYMAKAKTFFGGIHPAYNKELTSGAAIETARPPKLVVIPMTQHIGAPCQPLVQVGDRVLMGQKIGDSQAKISAPVHSSVSGRVVAVEERPHPSQYSALSVVIENDFQDEAVPPFAGSRDWQGLSSPEIVQIVREAGIVGLGGAAFPTHFKLVPPTHAKIEAVLLNGAECEPYLTCDHRIMLENAEQVIEGLRILMKVAGVDKGYIGVEENKSDAINALREACQPYAGLEVVPLQVKYPQGLESLLIKAISGKEVPSGKLPLDIGFIVNNVATAAAVAQVIRTGQPLIERVVTVTGSMVENPKNLRARIGTLFSDLLDQCGLKGQPGKVVQGGPMTGVTQFTTEVPVLKGVSGILVLSPEEAKPLEPSPCVRCARCVDVCPMLLQPLHLAQFAERGLYDKAEAYHVLDCRECGACTFICPSRRPLLQNIRLAKGQVMAKRRKE